MTYAKRIGHNVYIVGKFETREHKFIVTRNYFNLMVCLFGWGFAVLRHVG
jgi:hypothetical protein